ncbi:MAG: GNAT family N-acetyltransferase [Clostridium sp.]|uniref:GNAT family N-acetyltransferase n=1 Tax=Clostridium sp. TaxID=1506 RepID=UPI003EE481B2
MIKEVKKEDLNEMVEVYIKAFNNEPWNDEWTTETATKRLFNMMNDSGFYGIKIVEDKKIYGFILGHEEIFYNGKMFSIKEFCTDSNIQGKGYGQKLILELEERVKEKGIKEIILMTTRDEKAEGFYLRRGYEVHDGLVMMGKEII